MLKKLGLTLAAVTLMASAVNADPITDWTWQLDSEWTSVNNEVATVAASQGGGVHMTSDTLTWGEGMGAGPSQLIIANPNIVGGFSLVDDGTGFWSSGPVDGTQIIHANNEIVGGQVTLTNATLTDTFNLQAVAPAIDFGEIITDLSILFKETPNSGNGCCDDIFVLLNPDALSVAFDYAGYNYNLAITAPNVVVLTDAQCALAGGESGCLGLITEEFSTNDAQFSLTLTATSVPEPSILALMGLGLMGFGLRRRKKVA